jgi:hypothetical protein
MQDLLYVLYALAFFAISAGFVSFCERIIDRDDNSEQPTDRGGTVLS